MQMIECHSPLHSAYIYLGECVICRPAPCRIPRCLVKSVVGILLPPLEIQRQSEIVKSFAIVRIWIQRSESCDGSLQAMLSRIEFATPKMPTAQSIVSAAVRRIATHSFVPIIFWG